MSGNTNAAAIPIGDKETTQLGGTTPPNQKLRAMPTDPYTYMSVQGVVVEIIDEDDPTHGRMATDSIDAMSQSYLGESTYPFRDPDGGEVRSLYRVRPNKVQVFGHRG